MPFATITRPSLALGLLKAVLDRAGIPCATMYPCLDFAARAGTQAYHLGSHLCPTELMVGEWAFAEAAFGPDAPPPEPYLKGILRALGEGLADELGSGFKVVEALCFMRREAVPFVREVARRVVDTGARIVGCTTTMEQTVASLALLREIRRIDPSIVTMLGGANCETQMGRALHQNFPWIDYVVSGEAEGLLPALCSDILSDEPRRLPAGVLGPVHRASGYPASVPRAVYRDLDALPLPSFDDYMDTLRAGPLASVVCPSLPLETSRGCWWGARHHCTFCGLNGSSMSYRSKSAARTLDEMRALTQRYGIERIYSVDNILDHQYLRSVIPVLAESNPGWSLFFELKSNLKEEQVRTLRAAGTVWMQPGVESLHSEHLKLMDRGVQGWQNLQVLKWAREQGIRLSRLLLWGMPGENDAWFDDMAQMLPALEHLQPPFGVVRIRYDRYSVYHSRADEFGLDLRPTSALQHIFPLASEELRELAYCFKAEGDPDVFTEGPPNPREERDLLRRPGTARLMKAAARWRRSFARKLPALLHVEDDGDALVFIDSRACATAMRHRVSGAGRTVYLACREATGLDRLAERCNLSQATIDATLADLVARRYVLVIDGRAVALALSGDVPTLVDRDGSPGGAVLRDVLPAALDPACLSR